MPHSQIEEIKNRLDIAEVVGSYVKLQKAGANMRALCPFHSEKSPSFFVSPARQTWHCFGGCGEGGDIFKFIMKIEGVEFGDALRELAQKAGVVLKSRGPQDIKIETERKRLYEVVELTAQFFEKQLTHSQKGKEVFEYLKNRGMSKESIEKWRIGYSPENGKALLQFLSERGYKEHEAGRAGLSARNDAGSFDRFRGRIMFPVFDVNSNVVGFGGRLFEEKEGIAKYLNCPNTLLYDKSKVLYGLDKAKLETRKKDSCVLVEGYTDVIMVSQVGTENVVATSGTALTQLQLLVLKRYSDNLILAFDMDSAGDVATKRGIDLAIEEGFNIKVILMPEGEDPADIVKKSPKEWEKILKSAVSILEFYFSTTLSKYDNSSGEGKRKISSILLPVIKRIPNKIEQSHWIRRLSKELEVSEESIQQELLKVKGERVQRDTKKIPALKTKKRKDLLEERVISLIFKNPEYLNEIIEDRISYFSIETQEILEGLRKASSIDFAELEQVFSSQVLDFLKTVTLQAEIEDEEIDALQEFQICMQELHMLYVKEHLDIITKAIRKAEEEKDIEKVASLMKQFKDQSSSLK